MSTHRLSPADIEWTATGAPRSARFGDIYYSPDDGLAETRHVFLDGIGAPAVWQGRADFVIGETGFGSGLNFLAAWELWRRTAAAGARLHYVAVEAWPLARADLARALARWPELGPCAAALVAAWPHMAGGPHLLTFDHGRVRLLLLFGDATAMLGALSAQVDAWFLDGFAPRKNPDMWTDALFASLARLSAPGALLASFTVAGPVRRGLGGHGFLPEKRPGFGHKRECLAARFVGPAALPPDRAPWFAPPAPAPGNRIAVIGGGIAGLMTAHALHARGARVTLHERGPALVPEASGNPVAILEPWIDLGQGPAGRLSLATTLHALRWYGAEADDAYDPCGALVRPAAPGWAERVVAEGFLPPEDALLRDGGLLFPRGGMIHTRRLAARLAAGLDIRLNSPVLSLADLDADAVVLAATFDSERLGGVPLSLLARRGQISLVAGAFALPHVLSGKGYVTPAFATADGPRHLVGATFAAADPANAAWRALRDVDHAANLKMLAALLPEAAAHVTGGRSGLRATTTDHLPVMGALPVAAYAAPYAGLAHGRRGPYPPARYQTGRYVLTALGARGYLTAPLLAETLAAQILGQPVPLPRPLLDALHPARAIIRAIKRRQ